MAKIELFYVNESSIGCANYYAAEDVFNREAGNVPDDDIEHFADYETLAEAIEAADIEGTGLYFVSSDDEGRYTGMIRVIHGQPAEYREI